VAAPLILKKMKIFISPGLDRGRDRDGDEKKNLQKKIFIAITTAIKTATSTSKKWIFPLSVWEGYTRWAKP
jgi:hypothetical protein